MDPIVRSASQRKSLLYGAFVAEWMGDALHGDSLNWHELHFVVVGILATDICVGNARTITLYKIHFRKL